MKEEGADEQECSKKFVLKCPKVGEVCYFPLLECFNSWVNKEFGGEIPQIPFDILQRLCFTLCWIYLELTVGHAE